MSWEATTWALYVPVGGNAKVILLGLANHANPAGEKAYPCLETLATYASCDRATVWRNLKRLEADGWIVKDGKGPRGTVQYRLPLDRMQNAHAQNATRCTGATRTVDTSLETTEEDQDSTDSFSLVPVVAGEQASNEGIPDWKYAGRRLPEETRFHAVHLLAIFNAHSGKNLQPFRSDGRPSPHLTEITGAVLDHPDVTTDEWAEAIIRVLADPWWDGPAGVGQIFGPKIVDRCLDPGYVGGRLSDRERMMRELSA